MGAKKLENIIDIIKKSIRPLDAIDLSLNDAYGCVLAEDAHASIDQPPFPRSPLDGYAFKSFDTVGADERRPAILKLVDDSFAGNPAKAYLEDGCAVRIMTGGRIPDGSDCVIRQELVDVENDMLKVYQQLKPYENYCRQGEDYSIGQKLIGKGSCLDAASIAVLASSGFTNVRCVPKAKVAYLSTGDELRRPGSPLPLGCIYDSNEYYIRSRMKDFGIDCVCKESAEDNKEDILRKIKGALEEADLLITTGGVSVGDKDLVPDTLVSMGAEMIFQGISMKPGMPTLMASYGDKLILGLSGNPFSAVVSFEVLIKHILNALYGNEVFKTEIRKVILADDFNKSSKNRRFVRGKYEEGKVYIPGTQGNGQLSSMIGCNCLVDIAAGSGHMKAGSEVTVQLL